MTDAELLIELVRRGVLIGVEVFGTDQCCQHGEHVECPSTGYGLCDSFGPHSVGSDCNRADAFLMRPNDEAMTAELREAIHDDSAMWPDLQRR